MASIAFLYVNERLDVFHLFKTMNNLSLHVTVVYQKSWGVNLGLMAVFARRGYLL